jgi:hypothetical protein
VNERDRLEVELGRSTGVGVAQRPFVDVDEDVV